MPSPSKSADQTAWPSLPPSGQPRPQLSVLSRFHRSRAPAATRVALAQRRLPGGRWLALGALDEPQKSSTSPLVNDSGQPSREALQEQPITLLLRLPSFQYEPR